MRLPKLELGFFGDMPGRKFGILFVVFAMLLSGLTEPRCVAQISSDQTRTGLANREARWWKGNLHTHSLWSDGDDFPDMIASWYAERDYNFLALSDHNILSRGVRWMKLADIKERAEPDVLEKYIDKFGEDWVEVRGDSEATREVRLKPLDEFAPLLEKAGKFILIPGEEISDRAAGKPVHMNATNVAELIDPVGGSTVREAMQNNLRLVLEQEKRLGRQILPHLNHPNFGYAVTAEDLASVVQERFFEVYNGHPSVGHLGNDKNISIERMWDVANAIRMAQLGAAPLYGVATDDSHEYHGRPGSRPGRGWVMVRSKFLSPDHLIMAMKRGDFYASSGVVLNDVQFDKATQTLSLQVEDDSDAEFKIDFVATLKPSKDGELPPNESIGKIVSSVEGKVASYKFTGNELYVRAVVTSSLPADDPSFKNQMQQAWTQPVVAVDKAATDSNN
ncbi:PHP domain-containing protein [Mariniblastus fucicola]|uniref:PHP domain protein n=1 Tax=Mariniblastus fucicola TaxID=980251 RepID=A0A5B9P8Z9_9BACT|nr:hypothetical protein [Mariniblastus fucicola]QEG23217.1 hypothetical protein MFFC18_31130 [Mariniblastus fucicola]